MIEAVLFDFARTLVWAPSWEELEIRRLGLAALETLAAELGRPQLLAVAPRAHQAYLAIRQEGRDAASEQEAVASVLEMLERLGLGALAPAGRVAAVVERLNRDCLDDTRPLAGARETLEELARRGLRLGVASNATCACFVPWCLERHGLARYFDAMVVSGDCGVRKPRPEFFRLALDALGVPPERAVMVGDSLLYDAQGARQVGLRSIWLESGTIEPGPSPGDPAPDARLKRLDPQEVARLVEGW